MHGALTPSPAKLNAGLSIEQLKVVLQRETQADLSQWPDEIDAQSLLNANEANMWDDIKALLNDVGIKLDGRAWFKLKSVVNVSKVKIGRDTREAADAGTPAQGAREETKTDGELHRPRARAAGPRGHKSTGNLSRPGENPSISKENSKRSAGKLSRIGWKSKQTGLESQQKRQEIAADWPEIPADRPEILADWLEISSDRQEILAESAGNFAR